MQISRRESGKVLRFENKLKLESLELEMSKGTEDEVLTLWVEAKLVWPGLLDFNPGGAMASGGRIVIKTGLL